MKAYYLPVSVMAGKHSFVMLMSALSPLHNNYQSTALLKIRIPKAITVLKDQKCLCANIVH